MNLTKKKVLEEGVIMMVGSRKGSGRDRVWMGLEELYIQAVTIMLDSS